MKKSTGRVRLSIIPDASKKSLTKFIKENIEEGSTLITDGWKGYTGISKKGYNHTIEEKTKMLVAKNYKELIIHIVFVWVVTGLFIRLRIQFATYTLLKLLIARMFIANSE